jgi:DNA-binding transcriptional MerR regulator
MDKLIKISELSRILNNIDPKTKKPLNYILRYWEKEFKEIKPKKINNQRYYDTEQVQIIKMINFLLKNRGMTISGVKNLLSSNTKKLDDLYDHGLKSSSYKNFIRLKSKELLKKINKIKIYGKKNSS